MEFLQFSPKLVEEALTQSYGIRIASKAKMDKLSFKKTFGVDANS